MARRRSGQSAFDLEADGAAQAGAFVHVHNPSFATELVLPLQFISEPSKLIDRGIPEHKKTNSNPVEVSAEQIKAFAALYPMNARPIQKLNRRFLLDSF